MGPRPGSTPWDDRMMSFRTHIELIVKPFRRAFSRVFRSKERHWANQDLMPIQSVQSFLTACAVHTLGCTAKLSHIYSRTSR